MKTSPHIWSRSAMTLLEVMIVLFVLAILTGLLLPAMNRPVQSRSRLNCISNLKQIGLAWRMWSSDHGDRFPWLVMTPNGTEPFAESPETYRHFLAASNELNTPRILVCASDTKRTRVNDFAQCHNQHLSYFVGLDADEGKPQTILSGDRNIIGAPISNGVMRIGTNSLVRFGPDLHQNRGNVGHGDGSAAQVTSTSFSQEVLSASLSQPDRPFLRLGIPQ